ncbi:hypothetical protein EDB89DRAFT_2047752 [Lactarius sanguifluus]|nr:hypothetical protein EDB89DRAFT_2047752 [Lactarius sanguifluus]
MCIFSLKNPIRPSHSGHDPESSARPPSFCTSPSKGSCCEDAAASSCQPDLHQLLMRQNCAASGVALMPPPPSAWYIPGESDLAPYAGEESELRMLAEKGDGEKGNDVGVVGGAKGSGSCSACMYGGEFGDARDVSRFRKGGRPSWNASSSSCAGQKNGRGSDMSPVFCSAAVPPGSIALGDALGVLGHICNQRWGAGSTAREEKKCAALLVDKCLAHGDDR